MKKSILQGFTALTLTLLASLAFGADQMGPLRAGAAEVCHPDMLSNCERNFER